MDTDPTRDDAPAGEAGHGAGEAGDGAGEAAGAAPPRRLVRPTDDRMVAGVCSGLAHHLGVDPAIVRIATLALALVGGAGLVLYAAAIFLVPAAPAGAAPASAGAEQRPRNTVALAVLAVPLVLVAAFMVAGALFPLALIAAAGLAAWWVVSGEGIEGGPRELARRVALGLGLIALCALLALGSAWAAAVGGGEIVAGLVIAAGAVLSAGAFLGGARWLIPPALSVALAAGVVSAADLDLRGGVGERVYRPATAQDVRDGYRLGAGRLVIDLRGVDLPAGERRIRVDLGMGEAVVLVPHDACVATDASIGAGVADVFDHDTGGIDIDHQSSGRAPAGAPQLVIEADVGLGELRVGHHDLDGPRPPRPPFGGADAGEPNVGCERAETAGGDGPRA